MTTDPKTRIGFRKPVVEAPTEPRTHGYHPVQLNALLQESRHSRGYGARLTPGLSQGPWANEYPELAFETRVASSAEPPSPADPDPKDCSEPKTRFAPAPVGQASGPPPLPAQSRTGPQPASCPPPARRERVSPPPIPTGAKPFRPPAPRDVPTRLAPPRNVALEIDSTTEVVAPRRSSIQRSLVWIGLLGAAALGFFGMEWALGGDSPASVPSHAEGSNTKATEAVMPSGLPRPSIAVHEEGKSAPADVTPAQVTAQPIAALGAAKTVALTTGADNKAPSAPHADAAAAALLFAGDLLAAEQAYQALGELHPERQVYALIAHSLSRRRKP